MLELEFKKKEDKDYQNKERILEKFKSNKKSLKKSIKPSIILLVIAGILYALSMQQVTDLIGMKIMDVKVFFIPCAVVLFILTKNIFKVLENLKLTKEFKYKYKNTLQQFYFFHEFKKLYDNKESLVNIDIIDILDNKLCTLDLHYIRNNKLKHKKISTNSLRFVDNLDKVKIIGENNIDIIVLVPSKFKNTENIDYYRIPVIAA